MMSTRHPGRPSAATPSASPTSDAGARTFPPHRRISPPPLGVDVVGGSTVHLDRAVALDRLASGHGALTLHWSLASDPAFDLLAYADDTTLEVRGDDIVIDLLPGVHRVLVATGTRTEAHLPDSVLTVSNRSTVVECRLPGGTSHGVWPRISLVGVGEFVVILDERDPHSGAYEQVARAYDHDPLTFVRAGRG